VLAPHCLCNRAWDLRKDSLASSVAMAPGDVVFISCDENVVSLDVRWPEADSNAYKVRHFSIFRKVRLLH
jgi:hypothetical protein